MKILIGYDGSRESRRALEVTKQQAKAFSAEVCVFTTVEGGQHAVRQVYEKAKAELHLAKNEIGSAGIRCEAKLSATGLEPGEDIVQFTKDQSIDMIVIGISKRSKVGKFVFGSNAQFVILEASCPVLTVK